jgi:putative glutamine transport system substrate-binding protein
MRCTTRRALALLPLAAVLFLAALAGRAQPAPPVPSLSGDSWTATRQAHRGTLTVAYYYPIDGFVYRDANGKLTGLTVEIVEQFRSYLYNVRDTDVRLRLVEFTDFTTFYTAVQRGSGGVIGLAGTTITEERRKDIAFSPPYFSSRQVLVTNAAVPDLTSRGRIATELAGFTGLAFRGTTLEATTRKLKAESFPALTIEAIPDYHAIVDRLSSDPKAFAFLDLNVFWVERKNGAKIKRHRIADGRHEDFGLILPLGSDWQAPLGDFFAAGGGYRSSRAYRQLMIKHLGVDLVELLDTGGR